METQHPWYYSLCAASDIGNFAHLAQVGISVVPFSEQRHGDGGLLFFRDATQNVLETVRRVSRCGVERVLAISLNRSALQPADVWRLLEAGAADVDVWEHTLPLAQRIAARLRHWSAIERIVNSPLVRGKLIGESPLWRRALRKVVEIAGTRSAVLITGETGTGKEVVAEALHTLDPHAAKGALHVLDCTTIVPELAGSELFGHERGAFTHAVVAREGAFARAHGGTLFLDEIGELPLALQAQLLRVIQEHTYKRVGGNTWFHTDFRLICATNRVLPDMVQQGRFRSDLYHRLASWTLSLPPLRERRDDIPRLTQHFIQQRTGETTPELDPLVSDYLLARDYPGNVRDLKQVVTRLMDRHVGSGPITVGDIPEDERPLSSTPAVDWHSEAFAAAVRTALARGTKLKAIGKAAEDVAIEVALASEAGNLARAARKLGVTDRALQLRRAASRRTVDGELTDG